MLSGHRAARDASHPEVVIITSQERLSPLVSPLALCKVPPPLSCLLTFLNPCRARRFPPPAGHPRLPPSSRRRPVAEGHRGQTLFHSCCFGCSDIYWTSNPERRPGREPQAPRLSLKRHKCNLKNNCHKDLRNTHHKCESSPEMQNVLCTVYIWALQKYIYRKWKSYRKGYTEGNVQV